MRLDTPDPPNCLTPKHPINNLEHIRNKRNRAVTQFRERERHGRADQSLQSLVINSLHDACRGQRALWILCFHCGHAARVSPTRLAGRFGNKLLADLRSYIRCSRCRARWGAIIPEDRPSWDWPRR
jgi:hypothetical protein